MGPMIMSQDHGSAPTELPIDLRPNTPAPDHTRDDYDFDQVWMPRNAWGERTGERIAVRAPFYLPAVRDWWGAIIVSDKVWCKRHWAWEVETDPLTRQNDQED
jgi:hypothetical protein